MKEGCISALNMLEIFYLLYLCFSVQSQITTDPCADNQYTVIDDFRRDPDYEARASQRRLCDNLLVPGWYRFQINGTDADMPTSCVQVNRCGTFAPLWLSLSPGGLPVPGRQVSGNACVTWKLPGGEKQCCGFWIKVEIRNCGGEFFVYKLRNTGGCDLAYCSKVPNTFCPVGQKYVRHLEKCVDYRIGFSQPSINVVTINRVVYINCTFNIPNEETIPTSPTFRISWYKGKGVTTFLIKSTFITSASDALQLGEDVLPGETVTCSVEHGQERRISSPYFLGIQQINDNLQTRENSGLHRLYYISTIPIVCYNTEDDCKLEMLLQLRQVGQATHPGFVFSKCTLEFRGGEICEDGVCIRKVVTFKLIPNLHKLPDGMVTIKGSLYADDSLSWNQQQIGTEIFYEDLPSSVCFVLPGIQVLTFAGRKLHLRRRGTFVLMTTVNQELEIHFRVDMCEEIQLCICGLVVRYGDNFLKVDSCNKNFEDNQGHDQYTSHFYEGTNGQMKIYEGRSGWLIYIILDQMARIRLDFGQTGIVVAVLLSGYFTDNVDGLCGKIDPVTSTGDMGNADMANTVNMTSTVWRIRPGSSYFDKQTVPIDYHKSFKEILNCDCRSANLQNPCPAADIRRDPSAIVTLKEVTHKWKDGTNITSIPVYIFDGDYDTWPFVNESDANLDKGEAEEQCLKVLIISRITQSCGFYLDQYFEPVLQICAELARYQQNSSWIPITLRMLESLCEIGIVSNGSNIGVNNTQNVTIVDIHDVREAVKCPENCHGNGICTTSGCRCFSGYFGVECLKKAGLDSTTVTTEVTSKPVTADHETTETTSGHVTTKTTSSSSTTETTSGHVTTQTTSSSSTTETTSGHVKTRTTSISSITETTSSHMTTISPELEISFVTCDIRWSSCSTVYMELDVKGDDSAVRCLIVPLQFSDNGWLPKRPGTNTTLRYITNMVVECRLPDIDYYNNVFPVFKVQVIETAGRISSSSIFAVVNSDCQSCNKDNGCILKNDTCFIDGNCYDEFEKSPDDPCVQCQPDRALGNWSIRIDNRRPVFDRTETAYSILENDTLITRFPASDPDDDEIQYRINRSDAYISQNGNFKWKPIIYVESVNGSVDTFVITIVDECGLASSLTLTVVVFSCDCKNNGSCPERSVMSNSSQEYTCNCPDDFIGSRCETDINPCRSNPCYPGIHCTSGYGVYHCGSCPPGMIGDGISCFPGCGTNPCFTGVSCSNVFGQNPGFRCGRCPKYFYGDGIECYRTDQNPCHYDVCSPLVTCNESNDYPGYRCGSCPKGYLGNGTRCEALCFPPCDSRDICVSPGQCACLPDSNCTDCGSDPCFPGVICTNIKPYPGYTCGQCPKYFHGDGKNCARTDHNPCNYDVCSPLVTCNESDYYPGYKCGSCPNGYLGNGTRCVALCFPPCGSKDICVSPGQCACLPNSNCTDCRSDPCFPGVTCTNIKPYPGYQCGQCPQYFRGDGKNCIRTEENACTHGSAVCSRNESCEDIKDYPGYICSPCPEGYIGNRTKCIADCDPPCGTGNICTANRQCVCHPNATCTDCRTKPCFPGVRCKNIQQYPGYTCGQCPNFFEGNGINCSRTDESACIRDVCSRLVTCRDTNVYPGFVCSPCPDGYTGTGTNCIAECDPPCEGETVCVAPNRCECQGAYSKNCSARSVDCSSSPCFSGVECTDLRGQSPSFRCGSCPRFFRGNGIDCNRTEISACPYNVCSSLVTCNDTDSYPGYVCGQCPAGYKGDGTSCEAICTTSCTYPRKCIAPDRCQCSQGYGGYDCKTPLCCPKCQNQGTCHWLNRCLCRSGYYGYRCEKVLCNPPCEAGRICTGLDVCSCPRGYTGENCTISLCVPPCQHGGRCIRPNICSCTRKYCGPQCQYSKCRRKCQHGGVCIGYNRCMCALGFRGRFCQRSRCTPACRNGGVCLRNGMCRCQPGFYGQYCQRASCNPPCYNGGICRRQNVCRCAPGYFGRYCQHALCRRPCYNRGRCVAPNICSCRSGWGGRQCIKARCPFGCQNGGVCLRPGVCLCKRGYWGNNCQHAACWPRCMYGGMCIRPSICLCRRRQRGTYCQITVI